MAKTSNSDSYSAAEVRAGLLVAACAGLLFALLFFSGKSQLFQQTYEVHILFNYISGLSKNAPVHFAGHKVGKVTDIRFEGRDNALMTVTVNVSKDAVVKQDSEAYIDSLGFMGEKFVELTPGTQASSPLGEGKIMRGIDPVPMMEMLKKGNELLGEFEKTNTSLKNLTSDLSEVVGENRKELDGIFENLEDTSENLKDMTQDLKVHPWKLLRKTDTDDKKKHRFLFG